MGKKTSGKRRRPRADASEAEGPRAEAKRRLEEYERRRERAAGKPSPEDNPRHRPTPHIPLDESEPAEPANWEPREPGSAPEPETPSEEATSPAMSDEAPLDGAGVEPEEVRIAPRADAVEPTPPVGAGGALHEEAEEPLPDEATRQGAEESEPEMAGGPVLEEADEPMSESAAAEELDVSDPSPERDAAKEKAAPGPPEVQPVMTAPLGRRLLAFFVDLSLVVLVSTLNVAAAGIVLGADARTLFAERTGPFVAFGLLLAVATLALGVRLGGQTPGLALMGLEVSSLHGGHVPLRRALLRAVTLFAGSAALGAAGLSAALDPERRGFVDRWAGTEVVQREEP